MTKITFVGAGSMVFATKPVGGILSFDELDDSKVSLMNIGEYRPEQTTRVAQEMVDSEELETTITLLRRRLLIARVAAESRRGQGTVPSITLSGPVEIDEMYVLPEKRAASVIKSRTRVATSTRRRGSYAGDKPPVFTLVYRGSDDRYVLPAKSADESTNLTPAGCVESP